MCIAVSCYVNYVGVYTCSKNIDTKLSNQTKRTIKTQNPKDKTIT